LAQLAGLLADTAVTRDPHLFRQDADPDKPVKIAVVCCLDYRPGRSGIRSLLDDLQALCQLQQHLGMYLPASYVEVEKRVWAFRDESLLGSVVDDDDDDDDDDLLQVMDRYDKKKKEKKRKTAQPAMLPDKAGVGVGEGGAEDESKEQITSALQPEQLALQYVLKAEANINRTNISMQQGGGGGGGGAAQQEREDLRELFEVEMGQLANR